MLKNSLFAATSLEKSLAHFRSLVMFRQNYFCLKKQNAKKQPFCSHKPPKITRSLSFACDVSTKLPLPVKKNQHSQDPNSRHSVGLTRKKNANARVKKEMSVKNNGWVTIMAASTRVYSVVSKIVRTVAPDRENGD